jgi:hypothetical protein
MFCNNLFKDVAISPPVMDVRSSMQSGHPLRERPSKVGAAIVQRVL